jgi:hypothetical protein
MQFERCHARPATPVKACFPNILDESNKNHGHFHAGSTGVAKRLAPDSTHERIGKEVTVLDYNKLLERISRTPLVSYSMTATRHRQRIIEEHNHGSIRKHHGNHRQYAACETQLSCAGGR